MYNVQIIIAHKKQKPINQNYPKNNMDIFLKNVINKQTFEEKKPHLQVWFEEVEFGKLVPHLQKHEGGNTN